MAVMYCAGNRSAPRGPARFASLVNPAIAAR